MQGTIIVADKSRTVRRMVEISLAKHPFQLVFATDGASAADLLRSHTPVLAIVDAALPGNGYEVAGALKKKSDAKVLLLVGRNENFDLARAREAQVDGHLTKPFLTQQLVEKVFSALGLPVPDKTLFRTMEPPVVGKARSMTAEPSVPDHPLHAPAQPAPPPAPAAVAKATPPPPSRQAAPPAAPSAPPAAKSPPKAPPAPPAPAARLPAQRPPLPSVPPVPSAAAPAMPSQAPAPPPAGAFEGLPPGVQVTQEALKQTMQRIAKDPVIAGALNAASREALERVVWEVVPKLAEAILKEEIAKVVRERLAAS